MHEDDMLESVPTAPSGTPRLTAIAKPIATGRGRPSSDRLDRTVIILINWTKYRATPSEARRLAQDLLAAAAAGEELLEENQTPRAETT